MPELPEIHAKVTDEFFLAIGQINLHSFLMLGVVDQSGQPRLLARYGKSFTNDYSWHKHFFDLAGEGCPSRLANEIMAGRTKPGFKKMNYKAYAITYQQLTAFLALIADILYVQSNPAQSFFYFGAYLPEISDDLIHFRFYNTLEKNDNDKAPPFDTHKVIDDCGYINKNNTCRTFSVDMMRAVMGFSPGISSRFFIKPDYQSCLKNGELLKDQFYILPPPPVSYRSLSEKQVKILYRIYRRMEDLPRLKPENVLTVQKFNTMKGLYQQIAGENNMQATELLSSFCEYEQQNRKILYRHRSPNLLSRMGLFVTKTEGLMKGIKEDLLHGLPDEASP